MWVIIESNKGWEKFGAMRLLQNKCMWLSQTLLRKASDKVLWFFSLLQGNYSFLFPFRQWAAKWGVQQPRLHFHPGRASAANRGPADPGETSDFVQWCAGHCQVQVRAIPTHSFSPAGAADARLSMWWGFWGFCPVQSQVLDSMIMWVPSNSRDSVILWGSDLFVEHPAASKTMFLWKCSSKMWHFPLPPSQILLDINVSLHLSGEKGCLISFAHFLMRLLEDTPWGQEAEGQNWLSVWLLLWYK